MKQPQHGRTSTTKKQNDPPCRQTMINNSESFANRNKAIINKLGLSKHFEIYLIWNFQKQSWI